MVRRFYIGSGDLYERKGGKWELQDTSGDLVSADDYDALAARLAEADALLREWGTTYDDPRFPAYPPYGERIADYCNRYSPITTETVTGEHQ